MSGKNILLRGYNLECDVCTLNSWYDISSVDEYVLCNGCRSPIQLPTHPEFGFAYRLNHLLNDENNNGTNTVLLTLLFLYTVSRKSLHWQADVKVKQDKDNKEIELDIIAMVDGILVCAECKNSIVSDERSPQFKAKISELTAQLDRGINAAKSIGAKLYLFCTIQTELPSAIKEHLTKADNDNPEIKIRHVRQEELIQGEFLLAENSSMEVTIYDVIGRNLLTPYFFDADW